MAVRDVLVAGAKVADIALRPSQRWRRILLSARVQIDRLETPTLTTPAVDRQLSRLLTQSRKVPEALHPTALQFRRVGRFDEVLALTDEQWSGVAQSSVAWALACAKVWYENAEFARADLAIAHAKRLDPDYLPLHIEEARNQDWRGNASIARDAAERIIELSDSPQVKRTWSRFVAQQEFKFGHSELAVQRAHDSAPADSDLELQYLLAVSHERLGHGEQAATHYALAEQHAQLRGLPADARRIALHLEMDAPLAALDAASGIVAEQCSPDARRLIATAAMLTSDLERALEVTAMAGGDAPLESMRGLALELSERHADATEVYSRLLADGALRGELGTSIAERLARAAARAGRIDALAQAEESRPLRLTARGDWGTEVDPRFSDELTAALNARGHDEGASSTTALRRLLDSASVPENHQRIARLLTETLLRSEDRAALQAALIAHPTRLASSDELGDEPVVLRYVEHYTEAREVLALREDVILYESFHGAKISCNPLALCLRLLEQDPEERWTHVWAIRDGVEIPQQLSGKTNVRFVRFGSYGYQLHLATAGYLINNVTFPQHFVRRPGQRYLNTWHGVPWKHLGRDFAQDPYSFFNISRNLIQASDIVLPDEHTARKLIETQDIAGLNLPAPLVLGSPRVDRTLAFDATERERLVTQMVLDPSLPVVFYAPTWRGTGGDAQADVGAFIEAVGALAAFEVNVVLRVHHLIESGLGEAELPANVRVAPLGLDTNELLGLADVLVSDYSSLIFDFAPLNRPIIKYVFDLEAYRAERGLYFRTDEVPGNDARTLDELRRAIEDALTGSAAIDWSTSATAPLWAHEDGAAADRTLAALFGPLRSSERQQPLNVLVATGGLNPNGITRSLRNLFSSYVDPAHPLRLVIPRMPLQNPEVSDTAAELHSRADFTVLTGLQTGTRRERLFWRRLEQHREAFPARMLEEIRPLMQRERARHFGDVAVHAVVDFESYTLYNSALFALGFPQGTRSVGVLHSEFVEEMDVRFPKLRSIGNVLASFSALTSVSRNVLARNREELEREFGVPPELLTLLPNTIDAAEIRERALEPLDPDLAEWFAHEGPHVIAVGRLSTEKNPAVMIRALDRSLRSGGRGRLLLLGDGTLRQRLEALVSELGLGEHVKFAGQRSNPYPAFARADALLMSSLHEGQPMVLLEALTLGTAAVSTDIPGARAVLEDGALGLLVPEGVDGVEYAWQRIAEGSLVRPRFDAEHYEQQAVAAFRSVIGLD